MVTVEHADFVVIGGGIAGASVAYELSAHGRVALFEMETVCGYHTTGRSAALYTPGYEHGAAQILTVASGPFFESPPPEFADLALLAPLPALFVGRERDRAALERLVDGAPDAAGVEIVEDETLIDLCGVLRRDVMTIGVLERDSSEIDVSALHQGFLRGVRRRGGIIRTATPVTDLRRDPGGWIVHAGDGAVATRVVVNAAGAWVDRIAALAGLDPLGMQPMRRTAFTFDPGVDTAAWPMIIEANERFYFKPERHNVMGSLAEETPMEPHDARAEEIDVARAVDRIQAATTLQIRTVQRAWAGLRTFAPDRSPVNGFDPRVDGFYWLAGQGGFGIMTSPAMARAASGLIVGGELPDDLKELGLDPAVLSPERFVA